MKKYLLILLLACSFSNAQYNLFARQNFNYKLSTPTYNTYIGGVSGTIATASDLANKLGISVGAISNFTIVGSDIKCKITGSYTIPASAFAYDTTIQYYRDTDNLITSIASEAFNSASNLYEIKADGVTTLIGVYVVANTPLLQIVSFPNLISCGSYGLASGTPGTNPKVFYIPRCTNLGGTSGDNNALFGIELNSTLYIDPSLATNNAGAEDGDIVYARTRNATIRYVTSFVAPNPITDLSAGTIYNTAIQLNFTAPTGGTNAIDFYELHINGAYVKRIISGDYAIGLTASAYYNFEVYARDIYYNGSVSNTATQSTSNYSYTDTDANASIAAKSLTGKEQESEYLLITGLKTNSLYTKTQSIYTFKGTTTAQHKFNSKNPVDTNAGFRLTFTGAATFSNNGYQLNGSSYANTYFSPSAQQTLNSNGMTIVCGTNNPANSGDVVDIGSYNSGTSRSHMTLKNNNTNYLQGFWLNSTVVSRTGTNDSRGIFTGTKQSATVTDFFLNGSQISTVNSGGTLPSVNSYIGCVNLNGTPYGYSIQRIQMVLFHEGLSDAEVITLHSIIDLSEVIAGRKTW